MNCAKLFLGTNIMSHVDFLKYTTTLDREDHVLAIEILENYNGSRKQIDAKFYKNKGHQDKHRNEIHICQTYINLRELKKHTPNIYQSLWLVQDDVRLWVFSMITFIIQLFTLTALMVESASQPLTNDVSIYAIIFATTIFFVFQCYGQVKSSCDFWRNTKNVHNFCSRSILYFDLMINVVIAMVIPVFNIYFLLTSETIIDAVLNSTAIFFVIEIDDIVANDWDDNEYMDALTCAFHDYIMEPNEYDVKVVNVSDTDVDYSDCYVFSNIKSLEYNDDDDDDNDEKDDDDLLNKNKKVKYFVHFYCVGKDFEITTLSYKILGDEADLLIDCIEKFYCNQLYKDIHK